jgi:DNA-binding PadR family transcriptional regulator
METLTDLEAFALATLKSRQPCTPYAVRRCFRDSPSAHFSDSTGSVYPLLRRLSARGLVAASATNRGRRAARSYEVTPRGQAALRRWLRVPEDPTELVTFDPLRTRLLFLAQLPPAARERWLEDAETALRVHERAIQRRAELDRAAADPFLELAHANVLLTVQARFEWLRLARRRLAKTSSRQT